MTYNLKVNKIVVSLVFSVIVCAGVTAPALAITLPLGGSTDFATMQQKTLALVDASVNRLNAAEASIQNNSQISSSAKTTTLDSLNKVETALLAYRAEVMAATTIEELKAINQEIVQYLIANKDVIKANAKIAIADIGQSASAKAAEIAAMAEQMLKVLKVTCPSQASTISAVEQQVVELNANAVALKSAAAAKDSATIKLLTQKTSVLIKATIANIKTIQANCVIPTP